MVLRQIGKNAKIKIAVVNPPQVRSMRGYFRHNMADTIVCHVSKESLHFQRFRRGMGRRKNLLFEPVVHGSQDTDTKTRSHQNGFKQIGYRGFPIGADNPHQTKT